MMMEKLHEKFEEVRPVKKQEFNQDNIVQMLIAEPLNIDINNIITTNNCVMVNMSREDYTHKRVGQMVNETFNTKIKCNDNTISFIATN